MPIVPTKRDSISDWLLSRCVLPALIFGGLVVAVIGGYQTAEVRAHCRGLAAEHGYAEGYVVPNKHGPDQCVCRGQQNADGDIDMTISISIPLE